MTHRPSEECDDCFWWHEDQFLCLGCPNNPETNERKDSEKKTRPTMAMQAHIPDTLAPLLIPI